MNQPIGIPSGWEEKAAYRTMSSYVLGCDMGFLDINWSGRVLDVFWTLTHDWRVEP